MQFRAYFENVTSQVIWIRWGHFRFGQFKPSDWLKPVVAFLVFLKEYIVPASFKYSKRDWRRILFPISDYGQPWINSVLWCKYQNLKNIRCQSKRTIFGKVHVIKPQVQGETSNMIWKAISSLSFCILGLQYKYLPAFSFWFQNEWVDLLVAHRCTSSMD